MKNLKTNWLLKHTLTVFSCVLIVVLGIAFLSHADPVTTTIGENIATNDLSVSGNVTSGTWQGTAVGTQYGGTGQDWSAVAQGNLPYFSAEGALSNLAPGTAGQFLKSQGTGADPAWANVTRSATFVVAANDSSTLSKQQADYVCDGIDDQEEIQAAIDALTIYGGEIYLTEGVFYISGVISISSYTTFKGTGWGTQLKMVNDANCDMFHPVNGGKYMKLADFQASGNDLNQATESSSFFTAETGHAMKSDLYFQNLLIAHFVEDGIRVTNDDAWHMHINDCVFEYFGDATYVGYAINIQSPSFFRFILNDNQIEDPILFGGTSATPSGMGNIISGNILTSAVIPANCDGILIEGNRFDNAGYGIYPDNSNNITVLGNWFKGGSYGLVLRASDNSSHITYKANTYDVLIARFYKYSTWSGSDVNMEATDGSATIVLGNTSVDVTHSQSIAPTRIQLTPTTDTAGKRYWISAKGATTFTITIDSTHTSDISFDWRAVVGEGN